MRAVVTVQRKKLHALWNRRGLLRVASGSEDAITPLGEQSGSCLPDA